MLRSALLLCLAVIAVAPGLAWASTDVPLASAQESPSTPPPPLVPAPEEVEDPSSQEEPPPQGESIPYSKEGPSSGLPAVGRIPLEIMGGAVAGSVSGLLGYYVADLFFDDCSDNPGCIITSILTTAGGIFLGTPLGVYAVGRLAGGRGSFLPTLLGMAVGSAAGLAMVAALRDNGDLQVASIVTLPLAGAVIGYEISHALQRPALYWEGRADAAGAPSLIPMLGVTPTGGVFGGLATRF